MELTDRQQRELDYHREHAKSYDAVLERAFNYEAISGGTRRWWNAHWEMYHYLRTRVSGRKVLVVGCGFGDDALRIAKAGGDVYAFDLSPESLRVGRALAAREGLAIHFSECPAEKLGYPDGFFDFVVARDILHHVDIPLTVAELARVSSPGATWVINEIYSHTITNKVRHSALVDRVLYPAMQRFVYQSDTPYITEDERKLTEGDLAQIVAPLQIESRRWFNLAVQRVIPDRWDVLNRLDRLAIAATGGLGKYLGGRVLITGRCSSEIAGA